MRRLRLVAGDVIIIAVFLAMGLGGIYFNVSGGGIQGHKYIEIYVDNRLEKEISLTDNTERSIYSVYFGTEKEHTAIIEAEGGRVRMLPLEEELCPRGICSHTGWISGPGESIVCLPNRIMIVLRMTQDPGSSDVDGITR